MLDVYSQPGCMQCRATKNYLDRAGVTYREIDVSQDQEAAQRISALGYTSVPVVMTDQDHWYGFRPDRLAQVVTVAA